MILVTGASGGIGTAVSRHLAELGYNLLLAASKAEKLEALAIGLAGSDNGRHETVPVDMTDSGSIADFRTRWPGAALRLMGSY